MRKLLHVSTVILSMAQSRKLHAKKMGNSPPSRVEKIYCTVYYRDDVHQPFLTMRGTNAAAISLPRSTLMTLEDVAQLIEKFQEDQVNDAIRLQREDHPECKIKPIFFLDIVESMTIFAKKIERFEMKEFYIREQLLDAQRFTFILTTNKDPRHKCTLL